MGREGMGRKGRGRQGRGREGEGWEGRGRDGKGGTPNILLHPQFQFSRNMPAGSSPKADQLCSHTSHPSKVHQNSSTAV